MAFGQTVGSEMAQLLVRSPAGRRKQGRNGREFIGAQSLGEEVVSQHVCRLYVRGVQEIHQVAKMEHERFKCGIPVGRTHEAGRCDDCFAQQIS